MVFSQSFTMQLKEEGDPYPPSLSAISTGLRNGSRGCGSPIPVYGVHRNGLRLDSSLRRRQSCSRRRHLGFGEHNAKGEGEDEREEDESGRARKTEDIVGLLIRQVHQGYARR